MSQKQLQHNTNTTTAVDTSAYVLWTASYNWRHGTHDITLHDTIIQVNDEIFSTSRKPLTPFTQNYVRRLNELRQDMIQGKQGRQKPQEAR